MSDLLDIILGVDVSPIKTAKQELADLSNSFNSALKSASIFEQAFAKAAAQSAKNANYIRDVARANQDLINSNLKVTNSYKSAEDSFEIFILAQDKITAAYVKQSLAADKAAIANAKAAQANIGSNLNLGSTNAIGNGAGFSAMESELDRLKLKYDSAYAASKLFEMQSKEISFAMLNEAGNAETLKNEMDKLQAEYAAFQSGTTQLGNRFNQLSQATEASRKGVNRWGLLVQQTGYQAGDFLVQIQSGTNAFVAFGQQATQLVGILPMFSAELGISAIALGGITLGLSIAIPLLTALGAYFTRTSKDAQDSSNGIISYTDSIKNLSNELESLKTRVAEAKFGVDSAAEADALQKIADMNLQIFQKKEAYRNTDSLNARQRLAEEWSDLQNQAAILQVVVNKIEDQREAFRKVNNQIIENTHQYEVYYNSLKKAAQDQTTTEQKAADKATYLKNVFHALAGEAGAVSVSMNDWPGKIKAAIGPASALARYMQQIANGPSMMGRNPMGPGGPVSVGVGGVVVGPGSETPGGVHPKDKPFELGIPDIPNYGGGGGGGASSRTDKIQSLLGSLQTEQEVVSKWYEESQATLQSASDKELMIIGGRHEAELRLEQEHQKRLKDIKSVSQNTQLEDTSTFFGGMADIAKLGGDKTAKVVRQFSAAQALTNSYLAFTQILADPSLVGRPWARFGMAASALASGLSAVAAINSGSKSGVSGGSVGTTSTASAQTTTPLNVMIQGIKPTDIFTGEQLSSLFDSLYKENRNRGMVFQVAR